MKFAIRKAERPAAMHVAPGRTPRVRCRGDKVPSPLPENVTPPWMIPPKVEENPDGEQPTLDVPPPPPRVVVWPPQNQENDKNEEKRGVLIIILKVLKLNKRLEMKRLKRRKTHLGLADSLRVE